MIPEILSTGILSLNNQEKTLTQTLEVNFDKNYNIISTNTFESIFFNKNRLDYENFEKHFTNPESEIYENLQILYKLSQILKENRTKN
jgi:exoribonuclease R